MATARTKRFLALAVTAASLAAFAVIGGGAAKPSPKATDDKRQAPAEGSAPVHRATTPVETANTPSGSAAPAARRPSSITRGQVVATAPWGSGPGELGRSRPAEGAPEGPASFAVDARGRVHVLDQVNSRVQIFEKGRPPRAVPLPADTYQDIDVDARGNTVVLDRNATGTVALIDESGHVTRSIPLAGEGVREPGGVTGVFARDDGVWVEVEHASLVHIADASGEPDPARRSVQGRFSADGSTLLLAALAGPTNVLVSSKPSAGAGGAFSSLISFPMRVLGLHALEGDAAGRIYVAVNQIREADSAPFHVVEERETVVIIGPAGAEVGRVEIAPMAGPEEQIRPIRISPDGVIYELVCREEAAAIERYVP